MTINHILLTGSTGIVGSAIVPELLNMAHSQSQETHLYLPIRAKNSSILKERIASLWAFWKDDLITDISHAKHNVTFYVSNNLSDQHMGLQADDYQSLESHVTHIIHCAGSINLKMSAERAHKNTLAITQNILNLAVAASIHHNFKKLDYISTVGVAGKTKGSVPEKALPDIINFQNEYERFKAKAETLLLTCERSFPITIHRPSMVVGNSKTGKIINFKGVYFMMNFFAGEFTAGLIPKADQIKLDFVTSDYITKAVCWSNLNFTEDNKILHLCSGPEHCLSIKELISAIQHYKQSHQIKPVRLIPIAPPLFFTAAKLIQYIAPQSIKKLLSNLDAFVDYFEHPQKFENKESIRILEQEGIAQPDIIISLEAILSYFYRNNQ